MNKLKSKTAFKSEDNKIDSQDSKPQLEESIKFKRRSYFDQGLEKSESTKNSKNNLNTIVPIRKSKPEIYNNSTSEIKREEMKLNTDSSGIAGTKMNYSDSEVVEEQKTPSPQVQRRKTRQPYNSDVRPHSISSMLDFDQPTPLPSKERPTSRTLTQSDDLEKKEKKRPQSRLMNWMDSNRSESRTSLSDLELLMTDNVETQTEDNYIENNELFLRIKNLEKENMELRTMIKDLKKQRKENQETQPEIVAAKSYINESIRQSTLDN